MNHKLIIIEDNRIVVVAILHTSRDPQIWKKRN